MFKEKNEYKWKCPKCNKTVKWDGKGDKPDTVCLGRLRKHSIVRMDCIKVPK